MNKALDINVVEERVIKLCVENITVSFSSAKGHDVLALKNLSLCVYDKEFLALIGPSGCGKSTVLNVMAGLFSPDTGNITIDGEDVNSINSKIGYISQMDTLLPWRTVIENVALGLELKKIPKKNRFELASDLISQMGLNGFENSYPHELSGGMRKRVMIARILAIDPEVLFMDEPFGPLDAFTKAVLQDDILRIWEKTKKTIIYVTHDLSEAITLADRILLIGARPGEVIAEYPILLPRPRKTMEIKFNTAFIKTEEDIWKRLEKEIVKAREGAENERKVH
ncbi:ABC transporter ATP-binding protein [Candidatus Contubernalis alkaliaceticus]|uniref:ABC transporter ATP-binding protein n=1 Tax=Candidatus Contubernalis alkaliaceticus TaxID=338645 RepID=UPI001F4C3B2B|nr:ABC transporter ATP-binding protein [Candidatus Contubernalis alkalaceticus]UNC90844.1 ABC transporter ATP-binding protein [Candidatus Contubernalis alkalaceticus]